MITWELILALAIYNFIMYVTPGPNNSILTASGIKFGFARSIPNVLRWYLLISKRPAVISGYNIVGDFYEIPIP